MERVLRFKQMFGFDCEKKNIVKFLAYFVTFYYIQERKS